jgi:hypothetical protein
MGKYQQNLCRWCSKPAPLGKLDCSNAHRAAWNAHNRHRIELHKNTLTPPNRNKDAEQSYKHTYSDDARQAHPFTNADMARQQGL